MNKCFLPLKMAQAQRRQQQQQQQVVEEEEEDIGPMPVAKLEVTSHSSEVKQYPSLERL